MKVAIINFSGNVGKTTVARHLLLPRIKNAELISIESTNADEGEADALRGKDFAQLQQYMQTVDNLIVDIGASNVDDLLTLMRKFKGSHEDFDYYLIPAVSDGKQMKDTGNTLEKLVEMGVPADKLRIILNRTEDGSKLMEKFGALVAYLAYNPVAVINPACSISENEIYQRLKHDGRSITELASDKTDYKAQIAKAKDQTEKLALADKLAVKRLATGVLPELDACFEALQLQ